MRILLIGAGGQGQVVADAILFCQDVGQDIDVVGYLDDNPSLQNKEFLSFKVLGPIHKWQDFNHDGMILCIGKNKERSKAYNTLIEQGAVFTTVIHPRAIIGHDVMIGQGSYIGGGVFLATATTVGDNSIIHGNSVIGHHNIIGNHVHIAPGVNTAGNVEIGSGTLIGIGASIMPQRKVGEWATVGSATLVNKDVLPGSTFIGVPGHQL